MASTHLLDANTFIQPKQAGYYAPSSIGIHDGSLNRMGAYRTAAQGGLELYVARSRDREDECHENRVVSHVNSPRREKRARQAVR